MKDKSMAVKIESKSESIPPTTHRELAKIMAASGHVAPNPALWVPRRAAQAMKLHAEFKGFMFGFLLAFGIAVVLHVTLCPLVARSKPAQPTPAVEVAK